MNFEISFIGIFYSIYGVPKSRIFEAEQYFLQSGFMSDTIREFLKHSSFKSHH